MRRPRTDAWVRVQRARDLFADEPYAWGWEAEIRYPIPNGWLHLWGGTWPTWEEAMQAGCDALQWGYWRHSPAYLNRSA